MDMERYGRVHIDNGSIRWTIREWKASLSGDITADIESGDFLWESAASEADKAGDYCSCPSGTADYGSIRVPAIRDTVRTAISLPLGLDLCLWSARLGIPLNMCGNGLEKPVGQSCVLVAASCIDSRRTDLAVEKLSASPLPKTITKRAFEAPYPGHLEKPLTS